MTIPFKPRVAQTICRIDRKTQAVTAGVNFEDIDLRINGEGSEVYDYEYMFVLHSQTPLLTNLIRMTFNDLSNYSQDYMQSSISTATADVKSTVTELFTGQTRDVLYPAFYAGKTTGLIGNKRHVDALMSFSGEDKRSLRKMSHYTADTTTELISAHFFPKESGTITYSLIITAVPKIQYNPSAILLKDLTLSSQTADIIFGGVNDTEGVDDLDGDVYDYYVMSSGITSDITQHINENIASTKTSQQLYNNGSIASVNTTLGHDGYIRDGVSLIRANTGRKKISAWDYNKQSSLYQVHGVNWNPDTSTKMTSLMLRPSASISGNVQLYAVPKGYNADLTPWTFRQVVDIAGDFSAGHSFEIPDWAMFMKVDFVGESVGTNILLDFDNLGVNTDLQYLRSATSNTTAGFISINSTLASVQKVTEFQSIISIKNGANRPVLIKTNRNENVVDIQGLWAKDSSTVFTTAQIKASNTNTITGKLVVSFC